MDTTETLALRYGVYIPCAFAVARGRVLSLLIPENIRILQSYLGILVDKWVRPEDAAFECYSEHSSAILYHVVSKGG
jgi:hypothetical protein